MASDTLLSYPAALGADTHPFWFLPSMASGYAMWNLLAERQNRFYQDYRVVVTAGSRAGTGVDAMVPVLKSTGNPLETKTIALPCGILATSVSVNSGRAFSYYELISPETYSPAAFRVQTPWTVCNADGVSPNRALRQIADYSCRLNVEENNPERKVEEFISFLPVLVYDGRSMKQIDAAGIFDIAMSGTTATLLARRWESALLVNVDKATLRQLMGNAEAMTPQKKQELTEEETEYKSQRKQIQEKQIKFTTRVPIFMYLTDFRERSLYDVITQLEPGLFKKVTGLAVLDSELLVSLDVFNLALVNDAIYKFKRYEDASLEYICINKRPDEKIGLFDTVLPSTEYKRPKSLQIGQAFDYFIR